MPKMISPETNNQNKAFDGFTKIRDLFQKYGQDPYIGEPVSQEEHMCQAAWIAKQAGYDSEIVAGCLLHDIGH